MSFVPATNERGVPGNGLGLQCYELPGGVQLLGRLGTTAGCRTSLCQLSAQRIDITRATTTPDDPSLVLSPALQLMADEAP